MDEDNGIVVSSDVKAEIERGVAIVAQREEVKGNLFQLYFTDNDLYVSIPGLVPFFSAKQFVGSGDLGAKALNVIRQLLPELAMYKARAISSGVEAGWESVRPFLELAGVDLSFVEPSK